MRAIMAGVTASNEAMRAIGLDQYQIPDAASRPATDGKRLPTRDMVPMLLERLRNATLLSERLEAAETIKQISSCFQLEVCAGLPILIETLQHAGHDPDCSQITSTLLDILVDLVQAPQDDAVSAATVSSNNAEGPQTTQFWLDNTDSLLSQDLHMKVVVELLEMHDMWIRLPVIQLLTIMLQNRSSQLQASLLACPAGMDKVLNVLEDHRDEIRNELLLLLLRLSRNPEVQNFIAFSEGFEQLFAIMSREGLCEGGVIVLDCLKIVHNVLGLNNEQSNANETVCDRNVMAIKLFSDRCIAQLGELLSIPMQVFGDHMHMDLLSDQNERNEIKTVEVFDGGDVAESDGDSTSESASSAIERGVQGVRRIDQQRRALLNETKLTCMRLTLEMLSAFVTLTPSEMSMNPAQLGSLVQGCRNMQERLALNTGISSAEQDGMMRMGNGKGALAAVASLALLPYTHADLVRNSAESNGDCYVHLQLHAMRVLCEMVESHELSQAMLAQMTVGLASDKNAAANTNDTKYAYATALFVQMDISTESSEERDAAGSVLNALLCDTEGGRAVLLQHTVSPPPPPPEVMTAIDEMQTSGGELPSPGGRVLVNALVCATEYCMQLRSTDMGNVAMMQIQSQWRCVRRLLTLLQGTSSKANDSDSILLLHSNVSTTKELALRVPVEGMKAGEMSGVSGGHSALLFGRCLRWLGKASFSLLSAPGSGCPLSVVLSLLRLLIEWVYECPPAARALFSSPANLFLFDVVAGKHVNVSAGDEATPSPTRKDVVQSDNSVGMDVASSSQEFPISASISEIGTAVDPQVAQSDKSPLAVTRSKVLTLIQQKVGVAAYCEVLEQMQCLSVFKAASKGSSSNSGMIDGIPAGITPIMDKIHVYDKTFTRFYNSLVDQIQQRIIALYTVGVDGSGDNTQRAGFGNMNSNASAAATYQDIIRKQDRDLRQLQQQVKELQKGHYEGDQDKMDVSETAQSVSNAKHSLKATEHFLAEISKRELDAGEGSCHKRDSKEVRDLSKQLQESVQKCQDLQKQHIEDTKSNRLLQEKVHQYKDRVDRADEEVRGLSMRYSQLDVEAQQTQYEKEALIARVELLQSQLHPDAMPSAGLKEVEATVDKTADAGAGISADVHATVDAESLAAFDRETLCQKLMEATTEIRQAKAQLLAQGRMETQYHNAQNVIKKQVEAQQQQILDLQAEVAASNVELEEQQMIYVQAQDEAKKQLDAVQCSPTRNDADAVAAAIEIKQLHQQVEQLQTTIEKLTTNAQHKECEPEHSGASSGNQDVYKLLEEHRGKLAALEDEHADLLVLLASQEIIKSAVIGHLRSLPAPLGGDKAVKGALQEAYANGAVNYEEEGGYQQTNTIKIDRVNFEV